MARRRQHSRRSDCDGDYEAVARRKHITDDLIVMETTRLWLEEGNITDDLIAFVLQNSL